MRDASRRTVVLGVVTNLARLRAIVEHPAFAAGELHTASSRSTLPELTPSPCPPLEAIAAAARRSQPWTIPRAPARPDRLPTRGRAMGAWRVGEER